MIKWGLITDICPINQIPMDRSKEAQKQGNLQHKEEKYVQYVHTTKCGFLPGTGYLRKTKAQSWLLRGCMEPRLKEELLQIRAESASWLVPAEAQHCPTMGHSQGRLHPNCWG